MVMYAHMEKGVVPSDLWGTKSQEVIAEVKRNARAEIQSLQQRMQEEMEVQLNKQVEAIKREFLGGFNTVLTQLQKCFPEIVIPNLFSIPNMNEVQAADARSSATNNHAHIEKQRHYTIGSKKGKEEKTHNKQCEKEIQIVENFTEVKKQTESKSKEQKAKRVTAEKDEEKQSHYTIGNKKGKEAKTHKKRSELGKSKEERVTAEKDPNMVEHPPTAFSLFWERFRKDCEEIDLDSADNAQMINKMAVTTWLSMTNEDKKPYFDKSAKFRAKYEKLMAKSYAQFEDPSFAIYVSLDMTFVIHDRGQQKDGGYV